MSAAVTSHKPATARNKVVRQYDSQGPINGDVVLAGPATLLRLRGSNAGASALWILVFDATAIPGDSAVPLFAPIYAAASSPFDVDFDDRIMGGNLSGIDVANGITWAASTTPATLTMDGTNSVWLSARFH